MTTQQQPAAACSGNEFLPGEIGRYADPIAEARLRLIEQINAELEFGCHGGGCRPPNRPIVTGAPDGPNDRKPQRSWAGVVTLEWSIRKGAILLGVAVGTLASAGLAMAR